MVPTYALLLIAQHCACGLRQHHALQHSIMILNGESFVKAWRYHTEILQKKQGKMYPPVLSSGLYNFYAICFYLRRNWHAYMRHYALDRTLLL